VSDLIVFAQHSVCDGIALAILIRDTLMHIANPHLEVKMISPSPRTNYMPKSPKNIMIGFLLRPLVSCTNKQWSKRRWLFDQEDFLTIYKAFWQRYKYEIVMLQLEQDETERLTINCREHGVTVGSATSTAFIAAA
jgi:hypothetical protein